MKATLHFDAATHIYTVDGRRLPNVTGVLKEVFGERPWWTEEARQRGQMIHLAVEIIAKVG